MGDQIGKTAWIISAVFREEAIRRPEKAGDSQNIPSKLRAARSLQNELSKTCQSRQSIFLKQGKILADYEDDSDYQCNVCRYYPTYQDFSNQELRAYFSWRTMLRKGTMEKTSLSFAFLYIYELLNQIGVADPADGYQKLKAFQREYGQLDGRILAYLDIWIPDYIIYYGLDPALLTGEPQMMLNRSITVLEQIREQSPDKIMEAVRQLSPKWLERSRFYKKHQEDMDTVIVQVLRRVSAHYETRCKKTMTDHYFGAYEECSIYLFEAAVFCDPLKRRNYEYTADEQYSCVCRKGVWYARKRSGSPSARGGFDDLLKAVDAIMRREYQDKHPIQFKLKTKWLVQTIEEETRKFLAAKKAAEESKISIDFSQLKKIRNDAAVTREKLMVEEEEDFRESEPQSCSEKSALVPEPSSVSPDTPLNPAEYRLLQCLLYGGGTGWIQAEGYLLSVLADGINEKLYETFLDSVLDDTPRLVEEYIDDLKEMVTP